MGVTYKTAYRWGKDGKLDAYQSHSDTIIVRKQPDRPVGVALYARVSSAAQKENAGRQMQRQRDYAAAKGYQVTAEIMEIASGVNDNRPKLNNLLRDRKIGVIVLEHKDRLTGTPGNRSDRDENQARRGAASLIVLEDLNVQGMVKNRHVARALSDVGMGEFRRQTAYKSAWAGERLLIAPRF